MVEKCDADAMKRLAQTNEDLWALTEAQAKEIDRLRGLAYANLPKDLAKRDRALIALHLINQLVEGGRFGKGRVLFARFDYLDMGAPVGDWVEKRDFGRKLKPAEAVSEAHKWMSRTDPQSRSTFVKWLRVRRDKLISEGRTVPYEGPLGAHDD